MVDYIHEGFFNRARIVLQKKLKITQPGLIWNPALWIGNYKIYLPSDLQSALQGLYLDYGVSDLTETTDAVSRKIPFVSEMRAGKFSLQVLYHLKDQIM